LFGQASRAVVGNLTPNPGHVPGNHPLL
jgi:hypothetical protein